MTDTAAAPSASDPPVVSSPSLSPRDESRLALASTLLTLSGRALDAVPVDPEAAPGDLLRVALDLQQRIEHVVTNAVIAERERGTTWDQLGAAAGTTRQSAHEKWSPDIHAWAAIGRTARSSDSSYATTIEYAAEMDRQFARSDPSRPQAVTSGLDAVRFPGSQAYEDSLRVRGRALHSRLKQLNKTLKELADERETLNINDPADYGRLAENRLLNAETYKEAASVYDQLVTAEPALADEHRAEAEGHRRKADDSRDIATLLQHKAQHEA
ncbi:hypothetical protein GCM10010304_80550 [Streptomyces roseoviolaceus]